MFTHMKYNVLNFSVQTVDMELQQFQMNLAVLVNPFRFDKKTVHVTFESRIFVNFTHIKFLDGL